MTTMTRLPSKNSVARRLARAHFGIERGMKRIFRIVGPDESHPREPIKLLEVNRNTIASGIVPLHFGPHAATGVCYPTVIVEITPEEFLELQRKRLALPDHWSLGEEYLR